jgi:uncharacterized protein YegL
MYYYYIKERDDNMKNIKRNEKNERKRIEIVFLLDRSGSMGGLETDTIGGYNSFLDSKKGMDAVITTVLFDNKIEIIHDRENIKNVKHLTNREYYVRGSTALMDAIGFTINKIKNESKDRKVIFVITTDGLENASREYSKSKIKKMIQKENDWEFMYLGANINSYDEASTIGIRKERVSNYSASAKGTRKMFATLECAVGSIANGEELADNWNEELEN